ncbi:hypothetical protein SELR_17720 [Selenomonas ruminantium subsp. lactilytica TAM6421]|uniref:Uncharacterized protein n=1 Tax=Selenomonas ruminantium subsp. lactilytica (strain NBRC 103574 / TAM6421) TaxID=927704 RepID=I0GRU3_SELRL|nr:hypothetical protein SELR_17720 [Selenomonas ruminantium subsp. lactilytica TAM6421]
MEFLLSVFSCMEIGRDLGMFDNIRVSCKLLLIVAVAAIAIVQ